MSNQTKKQTLFKLQTSPQLLPQLLYLPKLPNLLTIVLLLKIALYTTIVTPTDTHAAYDPDYTDQAIASATHELFDAIKQNNLPMAHKAIKQHANINAIDTRNHYRTQGYTSLILAAKQGLSHIVILLLKHGALVNHQDANGNTALSWATRLNHGEIIHTLLTHGAHINHQDENGTTPLMKAAINQHGEATALLLNHGAHIHPKNKQGCTALTLAAESSYTSPKNIAGMLMLYGADHGGDTKEKARQSLLRKIHENIGQQNWDSDILLHDHILEQFLPRVLIPLICSYADPYYPTISYMHTEIRQLIEHNIRNTEDRIKQHKATLSTPKHCCAGAQYCDDPPQHANSYIHAKQKTCIIS